MARRDRIPQLDFRDDMRREEAMRRDRRYDDQSQVRDRIIEDYLREDRDEVVREMINNPSIVITPELADIVNDPEVIMDNQGVIRTVPAFTTPPRASTSGTRGRTGFGSGRFQSQFAMQGFNLPTSKRTRKKTKNDSNMSKALKQANKRLRTKSGRLRKGKTMRDVMKLAHKLAKK